jgi:hypothetical protein
MAPMASGQARDIGLLRSFVNQEFIDYISRTGARTSRLGADAWAAAGWVSGALTRPPLELAGPGPPARWNNLLTLFSARDEKLIARLGGAVRGADAFPRAPELQGEIRRRWVEQAAAQGSGSRDVSLPSRLFNADQKTRFYIVGDPGDGSYAQFAVAETLLKLDRDRPSQFAFLLSDVIYPCGDIDDYPAKFLAPYRGYERPLYAVPGNHDWDDGSLTGFMWHVCGVRRPDSSQGGQKGLGVVAATQQGVSGRLAAWLWRDRHARRLFGQPVAVDAAHRSYSLLDQQAASATETEAARQSTPYFAINLEGLALVGIDTGFGGGIDELQAEWLLDVSARPGKKILLTGKPLIVDSVRRPCWFIGADGESRVVRCEKTGRNYTTVDDVVRDPTFGYVAAIGGDVHNYQRYRATLTASETGESRTVDYVVSGGGGAFLGMTHENPLVEINESIPEPGEPANPAGQSPWFDTVAVNEQQSLLYPRRGHSLRFFDALTRLLGRNVGFVGSLGLAVAGGLLAVFALAAAAAVAEPASQNLVNGAVVAFVLCLVGVAVSVLSGNKLAPLAGFAAVVGLVALSTLGGFDDDLKQAVVAAFAFALALATLACGLRAQPPAIVATFGLGLGCTVPTALALECAGLTQTRGFELQTVAQAMILGGLAAVCLAVAWNIRGWVGLAAGLGYGVLSAGLWFGFSALGLSWPGRWGVALAVSGLAVALLFASTLRYLPEAVRRLSRGRALLSVVVVGATFADCALSLGAGCDWSASGRLPFALVLAGAAVVPVVVFAVTLIDGLVPRGQQFSSVAAARATKQVASEQLGPHLGPFARFQLWVLSLLPRSAHLASLFQSFGAFEDQPKVRQNGERFLLPLYRSILEVTITNSNGRRRAEFTCWAVTGGPHEPAVGFDLDPPVEDYFTIEL